MEMTNRERTFIGVLLLIGTVATGVLALFIAVGAVDAAFWWSLFLSLGCVVGFLSLVWADRRASLKRAARMRGGVPMERVEPEDPRIAVDSSGIDGPYGYRTTLEKPGEL